MLKLYSIFLYVALLFASAINARAGYLYAAGETASNKIFGYSVNEATGALTLLPGFPIATGVTVYGYGVSELLTIDRTNNRLYVVNEGVNTVSAYSINTATGALTALPFSPIRLPTGGYFTMAIHPSGSPLIIADEQNRKAVSYVITATTATAAAGSPFSTGTAYPLSSVFSRDGFFYYTGGTFGNYFAGFSVNATTGVLTALPNSPFNSGDSTPVGYAADSLGRIFMASTDGVVGSPLRAFATANGEPLFNPSNPSAATIARASDGVLSPNENFYIVADSLGNQVGSYRISGTGATISLTAVSPPVATGGLYPQALVLNSAGTFLFAANSVSRNITTYSFNQTSGALTLNNVQTANTLDSGRVIGIDYLPTGTTAASVTVSGRVTAGKRGVARAAVLLTDSDGVARRAITNPFGYYRFEDVAVGETYIIEVRSKQHTFATQVLNITGDMNNLNFYEN